MNMPLLGHTYGEHITISAFRTEAQQRHGARVEERQRVNGQPNGYRPISEAELQSERAPAVTAKTYKPVHGGYPSC